MNVFRPPLVSAQSTAVMAARATAGQSACSPPETLYPSASSPTGNHSDANGGQGRAINLSDGSWRMVYQGGHHDVHCNGTQHVRTGGGYCGLTEATRISAVFACDCAQWAEHNNAMRRPPNDKDGL